MRSLRTLPLLFALAFTAIPEAAFAQQDAALNEAQARFKEGLDLADANNHEAARLKFVRRRQARDPAADDGDVDHGHRSRREAE